MRGDLTLSYGRNAQLPDGVAAVWGARLIWPNDLVPDRQDLRTTDDAAKQALIAWLNGTPAGTGAICEMRDRLARLSHDDPSWTSDRTEEMTIVADEIGTIVASPQGSFGYVYVAGYLNPKGA